MSRQLNATIRDGEDCTHDAVRTTTLRPRSARRAIDACACAHRPIAATDTSASSAACGARRCGRRRATRAPPIPSRNVRRPPGPPTNERRTWRSATILTTLVPRRATSNPAAPGLPARESRHRPRTDSERASATSSSLTAGTRRSHTVRRRLARRHSTRLRRSRRPPADYIIINTGSKGCADICSVVRGPGETSQRARMPLETAKLPGAPRLPCFTRLLLSCMAAGVRLDNQAASPAA